MKKINLVSNLKHDLPASIVVFFVAIPLCLGIALASGAPLFSGLIAGIIGGILVGLISGSQIGVSGPAAGLAAIVLSAISALGNFEIFLLSVLGGMLQLFLGILKQALLDIIFNLCYSRNAYRYRADYHHQTNPTFGYDPAMAKESAKTGYLFSIL